MPASSRRWGAAAGEAGGAWCCHAASCAARAAADVTVCICCGQCSAVRQWPAQPLRAGPAGQCGSTLSGSALTGQHACCLLPCGLRRSPACFASRPEHAGGFCCSSARLAPASLMSHAPSWPSTIPCMNPCVLFATAPHKAQQRVILAVVRFWGTEGPGRKRRQRKGCWQLHVQALCRVAACWGSRPSQTDVGQARCYKCMSGGG